MNERDVPIFDSRSVKSILVRHLPKFMSGPLFDQLLDDIAKQIIEYAALCGVIHPRSTMK